MPIRRGVPCALVLLLVGAHCMGQSFHLKDDKSGELAGPFECRDGARVRLGDASYTVVRPPSVKPTLAQKLRATMIPEVNFRGVNLRDAIEELRRASVEFSPPAEERHKGVNMILLLQGRTEPTVTLKARDLSLQELLEAIASVHDFALRVEGNIVFIEPKSP